jgi:hypothetical protein
MFDANGNPVFGVGEWTAITSVVVSVALILCLVAVVTASKYRE